MSSNAPPTKESSHLSTIAQHVTDHRNGDSKGAQGLTDTFLFLIEEFSGQYERNYPGQQADEVVGALFIALSNGIENLATNGVNTEEVETYLRNCLNRTLKEEAAELRPDAQIKVPRSTNYSRRVRGENEYLTPRAHTGEITQSSQVSTEGTLSALGRFLGPIETPSGKTYELPSRLCEISSNFEHELNELLEHYAEVPKERAILRALIDGDSVVDICQDLGCTEYSVMSFRRKLRDKLTHERFSPSDSLQAAIIQAEDAIDLAEINTPDDVNSTEKSVASPFAVAT